MASVISQVLHLLPETLHIRSEYTTKHHDTFPLFSQDDVSDQIHFLPVLIYTIYIIFHVSRKDIVCNIKLLLGWMSLVTCVLFLHWTDHGRLELAASIVGIYLHQNHLQPLSLPVSNKAILITGCDRGIGHELAKKLDSLGYHVFAGCLMMGGPGERGLKCSCSSRLQTIHLDVTDNNTVEAAAKQVQKQLGNNNLWGIVNNAGICYIGNIEIMTREDINKIMTVNFMGPINVCRAFLPLLRRSRGRLVNVASNTGLAPVPMMGVYCASKSALATMSEVLRYELKDWGIKVSTIIPSGYRTGILAYDKTATADRWWKSASSVVREDYGKQCFTPKFKMANHESATSPDLTPIVNTIIHAVSVKTPKAYYYSGLLARSLPFMYLHLPQILRDPVMKILGDWFEFYPKALQNNNNVGTVKGD